MRIIEMRSARGHEPFKAGHLRIVAPLAALALMMACGRGGSVEQNRGDDVGEWMTPPRVEDEAALIARLSSEFVANPVDQVGRERNAIINYAIDHLLPVEVTSSGLFYCIVEPGEGDPLVWGERARAHYQGYTLDGKAFDSSYERGRPLEFYIGNMISGWNEGLGLLRPGGRAILLVPSHLAYGEAGVKDARGQAVIPPNTPLVFEIVVLGRMKE
jgi:FKBP-type peptidyl-prolyl cis-trans isomerase FkpA